jgi:hypothetical protein
MNNGQIYQNHTSLFVKKKIEKTFFQHLLYLD